MLRTPALLYSAEGERAVQVCLSPIQNRQVPDWPHAAAFDLAGSCSANARKRNPGRTGERSRV